MTIVIYRIVSGVAFLLLLLRLLRFPLSHGLSCRVGNIFSPSFHVGCKKKLRPDEFVDNDSINDDENFTDRENNNSL